MLCLFFAGALSVTAADEGSTRAAWQRVDAIRALLGDAVPEAGRIELDLPMVTQDGSSVSLSVDVNHPMNADDWIESLHLFALGNPSPELLDVDFTPMAGKAALSTRIRLDSSQTVVALARSRSGNWYYTTRDVRVTVSGCLSRDATYRATDAMQTRVRLPDRVKAGEVMEIRTMINHPMETGLRRDRAGQLVPEQIIQTVRADWDGEPFVSARLHRAVAANPYLLFHLAPPASGELNIVWHEGTGQTAAFDARVNPIEAAIPR